MKPKAARQAVAGIITRQILNAGFAECKRHPDKTRLEVFADVVLEFTDVLKPWGFTATAGPGPRSRGGIRVLVKSLMDLENDR